MSEQGSDDMAIAKPIQAFPVLADERSAAEVMEAVRENLGGGQVDSWALDRIKVALGGGTTWEIPSFDGSDSKKEFRGIILHIEEGRGYWRDGEVDGSPPDCASSDCVHGFGKRWADDEEGWHECRSCRWAQWGSKEGTRAQACSQKSRAFVLLEGEALPKALQVPAGSLDSLKKYMLRISSRALPRYAVVTSFKLSATKNEAGQPYSKIEFSVAKDGNKPIVLSPDMRARVRAYIESLGALLSGRSPERNGSNGSGDDA